MQNVVYLLVALAASGGEPYHVGYYSKQAYCEEAKNAFPAGWQRGLLCVPVDGSLDQRSGQ